MHRCSSSGAQCFQKALEDRSDPVLDRWGNAFIAVVHKSRLIFNSVSTGRPPWEQIDYPATPSAFLTAWIFNFVDVVKSNQPILPLLKRKTLNAQLKTALHISAQYSNEIIVGLLLQNGYAVIDQDEERRTPLRWAGKARSESIMRLVLEAGAYIEDKTGFGDPVLQLAAEDGNENFARYLLNKGAEVRSINSDGETALHGAAGSGNSSVVRLILEQKPDVNARGRRYQKPLHRALSTKNEEITLLLLQAGARTEGLDSDNSDALTLAVKAGHLGVVKHLLDFKVNVNGAYPPALWLAASAEHHSVVRCLFEGGADPNFRNGWSPIDAAAQNEHETTVDPLLALGSDINERNESRHTALLLASQSKNPRSMRILLAKRADINVEDDRGWTALHAAASGGNEGIMDLISQSMNLEAQSHKRETPLIIAATSRNIETVQTLLENGANVNATDENGRSRLAAKEEELHRMARILLEAGADKSIKDCDSHDALHCANERHHRAMAGAIETFKIPAQDSPRDNEFA